MVSSGNSTTPTKHARPDTHILSMCIQMPTCMWRTRKHSHVVCEFWYWFYSLIAFISTLSGFKIFKIAVAYNLGCLFWNCADRWKFHHPCWPYKLCIPWVYTISGLDWWTRLVDWTAGLYPAFVFKMTLQCNWFISQWSFLSI